MTAPVPGKGALKSRKQSQSRSRERLRWISLGLLLGVLVIAGFSRYISMTEAQPPEFEVVTAPPNHPIEIAYGPARITVETGGQVILHRSGRQADREITLQRGRVSARVRRLEATEAFAVRTAQAVAGVRGTVFSVALDNQQRTIVSVDEGKVEVAGGIGAPVLVMPGQTVIVAQAEAPVIVGLRTGLSSIPVDLPPPPAYQPPPRAPQAQDHSTYVTSSELERDRASGNARDYAREGSELDDRERRELLMQQATMNNPAPSNPAPQSPTPRSLR